MQSNGRRQPQRGNSVIYATMSPRNVCGILRKTVGIWREEFCRLHYGNSAKTIISYLHYIHEEAKKTGCHPACFPDPFELGITRASSEKIYNFFADAFTGSRE